MLICSSPYGDVSWNYDLCLSDVYHWVRLLTETWVEMPNNGKRGNLSDVRLLTETWVEICKSSLNTKLNRCSSPYGDVSWNAEAITLPKKTTEVRLLAETWIEINGNTPDFPKPYRSSPYGDVSWNNDCLKKLEQIFVRLLTETWVEIVADGDNSANAAFVSLRRRELKSAVWDDSEH